MGTGSSYVTKIGETVGQQIERLNKRILELEIENKELLIYRQREMRDVKLLQGSVTEKSLKGQITIGCVI